MAAHAQGLGGGALSGLWSAQQQQWLGALGHVVYVQGALAPAQDPPAVIATGPRPSREAPSASVQVPAAARPRPPVAPAAVDTAPVTTASVARRPASRIPDKLHFALIRAAACNPNAPGAAGIIAQWPPTSELRGNPAAKRALWPRLRALRRSATP